MEAAFVKDMVQLHGFPRHISNPDNVFVSQFWIELFQIVEEHYLLPTGKWLNG